MTILAVPNFRCVNFGLRIFNSPAAIWSSRTEVGIVRRAREAISTLFIASKSLDAQRQSLVNEDIKQLWTSGDAEDESEQVSRHQRGNWRPS